MLCYFCNHDAGFSEINFPEHTLIDRRGKKLPSFEKRCLRCNMTQPIVGGKQTIEKASKVIQKADEVIQLQMFENEIYGGRWLDEQQRKNVYPHLRKNVGS